MNEEKKGNNKIIILSILCIMTLIAAISGATYAFLAVNQTSSEYVQGAAINAENSLALEVKQLSAGNGKLMPILDNSIQGAASGSTGKNTCINNDDNTVCKVYSIKITNVSKVEMNVTGTLTISAKDMPNIKWAKGTSATTGFPTPEGAYYDKTQTALTDQVLKPTGFDGDSATFYVVIWISEQNTVQYDDGKFTGNVSFSAYTLDGTGNRVEGITSAFNG